MNKPPREYGFDDRMAMSQGHAASASIVEILVANIPGAVNAHQAHESNDRSGVDWWVEHRAGKHLSVDCKVREEDWAAKPTPQDDLALETFSVVEKKIPGWTRDINKKTDYVLWLWKDTRRWCLIPFPMLCAVFTNEWERWRTSFKVAQQMTPRSNGSGYHSECVYVPRKLVWQEIYRRYSGNIIKMPAPAAPPLPQATRNLFTPDGLPNDQGPMW